MRRKKMKEAAQISEILMNVLKKGGLAKKVVQYSIFEIWEELVGETIAKRTTPKKMQGNTLVVAAKSAAWAQELSFMKPMILKKIRERFPDAFVTDIKFTAGIL
jgi:predicted nucleic acid-binding Zn ribbon protein